MDQKGQKPGKDMSLIFLKLSGRKMAYKLFPSFSFIFYSIILLFSLMTVLHCMSCFSYSYGHCSATSFSSLDPFTLLIVLLWLVTSFSIIYSPLPTKLIELHFSAASQKVTYHHSLVTYHVPLSLNSFLQVQEMESARAHLNFAFKFYSEMGYALTRWTWISNSVNNSSSGKGQNTAWQTAELIQSQGSFKKVSNFRIKSCHLATPLSLQLPLCKKKTFHAFLTGNLQCKCGFTLGKTKIVLAQVRRHILASKAFIKENHIAKPK